MRNEVDLAAAAQRCVHVIDTRDLLFGKHLLALYIFRWVVWSLQTDVCVYGTRCDVLIGNALRRTVRPPSLPACVFGFLAVSGEYDRHVNSDNLIDAFCFFFLFSEELFEMRFFAACYGLPSLRAMICIYDVVVVLVH